ncbi:MAG TPA: DUF3667 domain-containing protein [Longimicrobium sp.]|nr:DUF3667 domain-containing protein [Longimicrobium sp.]
MQEQLCANCGSPVPETFCGVCGQRHGKRLVSVRRMLKDLLDDQLLVNSALPRTLHALVLRPGMLTREYAAGRIVRYIAPFRLYLVSSLVFFLIVTLLANPVELGERVERNLGGGAARTEAPAEARGDGGAKYIQFGPMGDTAAAPEWWKPAARRLAAQEDRINGMRKGQIVQGIVSGLEQNAPTAMFLLLPFYAAILKLLYRRRDRLYAEHFVFALHVHAFSLLLFSLLLLARPLPALRVLVLWAPVYAFLAMRRVYGQGLLKTSAKFVLLGASYLAAFLAGLFVTVVVAALTI